MYPINFWFVLKSLRGPRIALRFSCGEGTLGTGERFLLSDRRGFFSFTAILAFSLMQVSLAAAQTLKQTVDSLESQLKGKVCFLHQPLRGEKLEFAADGKLLSKFDPGTWPTQGGFLVESVKEEKGAIRFDGKRVLIYFDQAGKLQTAVGSGKLRIKLAVDSAAGPAQLNSAMKRVFLLQGSSPADEPPPPEPTTKDVLQIVGKLPNGEPIYCFGRGITPPRAVHTRDPAYPEELRQTRMGGTVVLRIVVDSDGTVHSIGVKRTFHPLFDVAAAMAVKDWTFRPATLNGKPVAMVVNVEMNFRLY
jgi:TonB family protein